MDRYNAVGRFQARTLKKPVNALAFNADGSLLAICSDDHSVHVLSVASGGSVSARISTHGGPMAAAQWIADMHGGNVLVVSGRKGLVRLYRIQLSNGRLTINDDIAPLTLGKDELKELTLDPSGHWLSVVSSGRIYLLQVDAESLSPLTLLHKYPPSGQTEDAFASSATFCNLEGGITVLVVAYTDSRNLRAFSINPWAKMWDLHTSFRASTIDWVISHQCLIVYCLDALNVKVVELRGGQMQHKKTLEFRPANERYYRKIVRTAENGRLVLCGSDRGSLVAWDLQTGKESPVKLEHGRGDVGADEGYPGLQVIACKSMPEGGHIIAGSSYAFNPRVTIWSTVKKQSDKSVLTASHIFCLLFCVIVAGWAYLDKTYGVNLFSATGAQFAMRLAIQQGRARFGVR
ncbi:WD40 repeat-like protein [Peniophora sp. CONT]|nr:WD40 repeat-like protein [Peniophora sp. CONT]